jgi:hypothetical protein
MADDDHLKMGSVIYFQQSGGNDKNNSRRIINHTTT